MPVDEIKLTPFPSVMEARATPETVEHHNTELAPALVFSHQEPLQTPSLFVPVADRPQLENVTLSSEATDEALMQRLVSSRAPLQEQAAEETSTSMANTWNIALGRYLSAAPEQDLLLRANIYQGLRKYEALQLLSENARKARLQAQLITDPEAATPSKEGNAVEEHDDPALEAERVKLVRRKHARK